ncbi:MAG: LAGLIDADG family homing endonuclease [Patescibacteria group bacterium]
MTTDEKKIELEESLRKTGFTRNKLKYSVDESFFDKWTRQMAYILGFTFADGNIHHTSLSWDLQKRDKEILVKIKKSLRATYPIKLQRKTSYRFRINNQILIKGAIQRGLLPKKNIRNELPKIPKNLLRHFVRGYLDGDGWLIIRNRSNNNKEIDIGFSSGNRKFLEDLKNIISRSTETSATQGVRKKLKNTPKKVISVTYMLEYYTSKAMKIANWLYSNLGKDDLFLDRKYKKYLLAKQYSDFIQTGISKLFRSIQKKSGKTMKEILEDLYTSKGYRGEEIARILKVHSSSIYRWLARTGIKYPQRRITYG